jgi:hypothetical protein
MVLWGKAREPAKVGEMPNDEHEGDERINVVIDSDRQCPQNSALATSDSSLEPKLRVVTPII